MCITTLGVSYISHKKEESIARVATQPSHDAHPTILSRLCRSLIRSSVEDGREVLSSSTVYIQPSVEEQSSSRILPNRGKSGPFHVQYKLLLQYTSAILVAALSPAF